MARRKVHDLRDPAYPMIAAAIGHLSQARLFAGVKESEYRHHVHKANALVGALQSIAVEDAHEQSLHLMKGMAAQANLSASCSYSVEPEQLQAASESIKANVIKTTEFVSGYAERVKNALAEMRQGADSAEHLSKAVSKCSERVSLTKAVEIADASAPSIILSALRRAEHDLAFLGGCTHTDRPDLPLSPDTSWTTDVTKTLAAISAAIAELGGKDRCTDPGCAGCSSCQPSSPSTTHSIDEGAHGESRKPDGDRS